MVFLTCNIDPKSQKPGGLDQKFKEWQISLPIYVDSQNFAKKGFRTPGVPATIIIGPKGKIQAYQSNIDPRHVFMLQQAVRAVADGKNVAEQQLGTFNMVREDYGVIFKRMVDEDLFVNPQSILRNIEIAGVAKQSAPKHFKMSQLWLSKKLELTGNVLVLDDMPAPRILVCNNSRAVAEFDTKGQMLGNHQFRIPPDAAISNLRTAKTADGRRFYVGFAPSTPQCFLLDDKFQVKMSYPSNLKDSPPDGIADVQIADLTGDGTPEIFVGYRGKAGVKAISLAGQELWVNRDVTGITKMAIASRNPDSGPMLLCTSDKCLLFGVDGKGGIAKRWDLGNRRFYWIASDQPSPAGKVNLCGLMAPDVAKNEAIGLGLTGDMLWAYGLPDGPPGAVINRVTTGRVLPGQGRQWVFLGADSSIHLVSEQGKLLDRFNYGAFVAGIATATINNRSVLIISSFRGVEAITLEPK